MRVLAFGDSLTAGYGLPSGQSFADQLASFLQERDLQVTMFNAGLSGDTSAGGRARIEWSLQDNPHLVILELGANDGLRGLDPIAMEKNLEAVIKACRDKKSIVILAGMLAPRNMGKEYKQEFDQVFPRLAQKYNLPFYPFFLQGVAGKPELNLNDGIHPTREGISKIVEGIGPLVVEELKKIH